MRPAIASAAPSVTFHVRCVLYMPEKAGPTLRIRVPSPRQLAALAVGAVALTALAMRVWGLAYGLPNLLARPDEEKIVGAAAALVREGRWRPATLIYPSLLIYLQFDRLAARPDTRLVVADWVSKWLPPRSRVVLCHGYTRPEIPFRTRTIDCAQDAVPWSWADAIILPAQHPQLDQFTGTSGRLRAAVQKRGRHLTAIDPFVPGRAEDAWFYSGDAFFIPMRGLDAMQRGGPGFDVYALPRPGGAFPSLP